MEKSIRLSKNQTKNARKKAAKELLKKQFQQEYSSSSSEGKIMIGKEVINLDQNENKQELQIEMKKLKTTVSNYEETIFNLGERIRELMNNIEDQNNELLILRRQLIQNKIVTEQEL